MDQQKQTLGDYYNIGPSTILPASRSHHRFRSLFCALEWDSGADVGYFDSLPNNCNNLDCNKLSTIERMALARTGCSAVLRQDPEGTTEESQSGTSTKQSSYRSTLKSKPDANSTPIVQIVSGSESDIELTPIVKEQLFSDALMSKSSNQSSKSEIKSINDNLETPKVSSNVSKKTKPQTLMYPTENEGPLKKSSSMNFEIPPMSRFPLKRSQSDLNLCTKNKLPSYLISNSASSIITVVNKPPTCDKLIQTTLRNYSQESVGVQASSPDKEEDKPPLPKRDTSLNYKSVNSILKNPKQTYKVGESKILKVKSNHKHREVSSSESSRSSALTPQNEDNDNITGRANSFEYFPGHVYENVPNESTSIVSTIDTRGSNSTMPNTSSSIDEKLWGNSNSLVRDLERSVNILKSLVDANKLNKQVKERLIHHVVKRLVTAQYNDDKIQCNIEDKVPWNPEGSSNKVYRTEIIQALAKNVTDSSDDWKPQKKKTSKKTISKNEEKSVCAKFEKIIDRTELDGRKARMGLRTDERKHHHHESTNSNTPVNKSESSECFLPHSSYKNDKMMNIYGDSLSPKKNKALRDNIATSRQTTESSNDEVNSDWRLPATMSERKYELRRCNNSDSGDSKLLSYAEMEKQNQLIWIKNEISHLTNLKDLLEQTKKLDKPKKISPRRTNQFIKKSQIYEANGNSSDTTYENQLNKQWSSHCNLAAGLQHEKNKHDKFLMKRHSCTQTATDKHEAYSKTSGETIAVKKSSNQVTKLLNTWIQTQKEPPRISNPQQIFCPVHEMPLQNVKCKCGENYEKENAESAYFSNSKEQHSSSASEICNNSEDNFKQKETKNQVNSMKSGCKCDDQVTRKISNNVKRLTLINKETACQCKSTHICLENSSNDLESSNYCSCEKKNIQDHYCTKQKAKRESSYFKKCLCHTESKMSNLKNIKSKSIIYSEGNYKSCRVCGKTYQYNRECKCVIQYPKPVAYELSFSNENKSNESFDKKINCTRKPSLNYRNNQSVPKNICSCGKHRSEELCSKKLTLQESLALKNPTFVDNVETRRQYFSEVMKLRQLRQENKIHLLAMSSSTTALNLPKPIKKMSYFQKQISDEELKMRVKKRYSQLSEVRAKKKQEEKEKETRCNKLMAKIYCKKLQQKALKGQVNLSQSKSVFSNI